ncbi:MAG: hypothetical protein M3Z32_04870, partial [Acidobacteriota bacterium]|nr:hypothetical protein [Acidobacteriota bacterium]
MDDLKPKIAYRFHIADRVKAANSHHHLATHHGVKHDVTGYQSSGGALVTRMDPIQFVEQMP